MSGNDRFKKIIIKSNFSTSKTTKITKKFWADIEKESN